MARIDKRLQASRNVGPGSDLHQRIQAEGAYQSYLFGGRAMGPLDNGTRAMGVLPGGGRTIHSGPDKGKTELYYGDVGRIDNSPAFKNVDPNAIRLTQNVINRETEVGVDMSDSGAPSKSSVAGGRTKLQDMGFREETPTRYQNAPVRTWVDESIKIKKD